MAQPGLGRLYVEDPRDEAYPLRAVVAPPPPDRRYRYWWPSGGWADQGNTGTCVGHGWWHWLKDGPITHPKGSPLPDPYTIYRESVLLDPFPGNDREATAPIRDLQYGTTGRAGAKALQRRGLIGSYYHGRTLDDLVLALLSFGPVAWGVNWYDGMFETDKNGFIRPTGRVAGGHFTVLNGVNLDRGEVRGKNSWATMRHFRMTFEDVERLMRENGEVIIATENKL